MWCCYRKIITTVTGAVIKKINQSTFSVDQSESSALTFLSTTQMQHYEVGDALVLGEGQTQ